MSPTPRTSFDCILKNCPQCIRERKQWVAWKYVERSGKPTKAPVNPVTGKLASSTKPSTWGTFSQAMRACNRKSSLAGIGFVFTADDPYCGVDLDDCIEETTGELKPWGRQIVDLLDSYTEISPSGNGLKIFIKGNKPFTKCRKAYADGEVEIYDRDRFFTVTGERLSDAPAGVNVRQESLERVCSLVFKQKDTPPNAKQTKPTTTAVLSDDEIINLASHRRLTGDKFSDLFEGRWESYYPSASEADAAFVCFLANYTLDLQQIDRIFRSSQLMRPKWDEKHGKETYGQLTINSALVKVGEQGSRVRKRRATRRPIPALRNPKLPGIIVDDRQLSDLTHMALAAMNRANTPPAVFVRGGVLVRVVLDEHGIPVIEELDMARVRCRLTKVANFFTLRKTDEGYIPVGMIPPSTIAENILAQESWDFPPLAGIARSPILHSDGTICTKPGYDSVSRLKYCPDPSLKLKPIPDFPCGEEVRACTDILLRVIADFPFVDDASRANAMAILFSILMRPVIKGNVPLAIIDAPTQGTGKTLLISALATIAVGKVASESIPTKKNEDEWRKKITSILMASAPFVLLDNIPDNSTVDSPVLAATLTSSEVSDRLLGSNRVVTVPSRSVWAATGNNLRVTGDLPRRSYSIRVDSNVEVPWQRTGFQIRELVEYASENRGELLSAALTIIRAWYTNGKPMATVPPLGSFQEWADTIGSVLAFAGIDGFLTNREQTQVVQDESLQEWMAFFDAWWGRFGSRELTADDICRVVFPRTDAPVEYLEDPFLQALPSPLITNRNQGAGSFKRSLGRQLSKLRGRIFNGRKLTDAGFNSNRHVRLWKLEDPNAPPSTLFDLEGSGE